MNTKLLSISAFLAAAMLAACSGSDKESGKKTQEEAKPVVKVATVNDRDVAQTGRYTATVEPAVTNNISASQPNRIKQIFVDEGMRVSRGQRLAVMDDVNTTSYQLQLDNAKAALRNVQNDYNRVLELYKIGGGTKQSVDQMETQLINARNTVASAERALRNVRENTVLVSPIDGVVTARNYDPGDMTGSLPILSVARVNPVKIVINVSESELAKIHKGMPATITFDTYGDEKFSGKVAVMMPTVDPASRTFGVEITVDNSSNRLLPGMFGRVELNLGHARHVVVPDRAVIKQPGSGNHFVYVYDNGKVKYCKVELGQRLADSYELLSGVEPGSQVVVTGQNALADGREVTVSK